MLIPFEVFSMPYSISSCMLDVANTVPILPVWLEVISKFIFSDWYLTMAGCAENEL